MIGTMAKKRQSQDNAVPNFTPQQIKAMREARDMLQVDAAAAVGVGQGVWSAWEKGKRVPSRQSMILLDLFRRKKIP